MPYIISDVYPATAVQPTKFVIVMDGGAAVESDPQVVTGGVRLHYDVSSVSVGTHSVTVAAKNAWGSSPIVPFTFTKSVPVAPTNIRLE
jgi:hypothetical protein